MDIDWTYLAYHWKLIAVPYIVTTALPLIFLKWQRLVSWRELFASWLKAEALFAVALLNVSPDPDPGALILAAAVVGLYKMFFLTICGILISLIRRRRSEQPSA